MHSWNQFRHVRSRWTVRRALAELVKKCLEFIGSSDYDAYAQNIQLEEQTKGRKVSIVERVFVVPLDFDRDPISEVVDFVCRCQRHHTINGDLDFESVLLPVFLKEEVVETLGDRRFAPAWGQNLALRKAHLQQRRYQLVPLLRKICLERGACMVAFLHHVVGEYFLRKQIDGQSDGPPRATRLTTLKCRGVLPQD